MKHLLTVRDLNAETIRRLFELTARLKRTGQASRPLAGKTLGLLFQKPSLRTRVSFEVGMAQLGGQSIYIGPVELQGGQREGAKDLANVLSRYLDGIVARTYSHDHIVEMAAASSVPVINGLSDESHPCQALADLFTVHERFGKLKGVPVAYVGDGNNVCHSLMEASALTGVHLRIAAPRGYTPAAQVLRWAGAQAKRNAGTVELCASPDKAVKGAWVVYTDVWTSMGQEKEAAKREKVFRPYQVNSRLFRQADPQAVFMHCLPAHRGQEVTDQVMDSTRSIVYDQAENRLHVQKAILLELLGKGRSIR
ncbi:MAG: ornithine carbamoyltransferase [Candidatus Omnitrophica bacterium]|nr:ornithine carbamoyltransferase [Candidatus Omnitrophota bacterium]